MNEKVDETQEGADGMAEEGATVAHEKRRKRRRIICWQFITRYTTTKRWARREVCFAN